MLHWAFTFTTKANVIASIDNITRPNWDEQLVSRRFTFGSFRDLSIMARLDRISK
jgi:hypothetical protein